MCPQLRAEGQPSDLAHGSGKVYEKLKAANLDAKVNYTLQTSMPIALTHMSKQHVN